MIKERLDLAPHLRELDATIEGIELRLRELVDATLNRDPGLVPGHIAQKVDERAGRTHKKSAVFDAERYDTLAGRLEYFDLREIQELIQNKALWPKFEARFVHHETPSGKFNQLAELRNGIRHCRSVDEITRKEGEAAILWFQQVLK